jgi:hypothetical protein
LLFLHHSTGRPRELGALRMERHLVCFDRRFGFLLFFLSLLGASECASSRLADGVTCPIVVASSSLLNAMMFSVQSEVAREKSTLSSSLFACCS